MVDEIFAIVSLLLVQILRQATCLDGLARKGSTEAEEIGVRMNPLFQFFVDVLLG
jgi:hypothetical protein